MILYPGEIPNLDQLFSRPSLEDLVRLMLFFFFQSHQLRLTRIYPFLLFVSSDMLSALCSSSAHFFFTFFFFGVLIPFSRGWSLPLYQTFLPQRILGNIFLFSCNFFSNFFNLPWTFFLFLLTLYTWSGPFNVVMPESRTIGEIV